MSPRYSPLQVFINFGLPGINLEGVLFGFISYLDLEDLDFLGVDLKTLEGEILQETLKVLREALRCGFLEEVCGDDYCRGCIMYTISNFKSEKSKEIYEYAEKEFRKNGFDREYWERWGREDGRDRIEVERILEEDEGGWRNVRRVESWCVDNLGGT